MSEDIYKKVFSKNLKYYMEKKNKNQTDLMNDLGFSSSTVSNWCTGLKLPRMDKVQMLADYFGIGKSDLLEDRTENSEPEEIIILSRAAKKMTPEKRQQLLEMAKVMFKEEFND